MTLATVAKTFATVTMIIVTVTIEHATVTMTIVTVTMTHATVAKAFATEEKVIVTVTIGLESAENTVSAEEMGHVAPKSVKKPGVGPFAAVFSRTSAAPNVLFATNFPVGAFAAGGRSGDVSPANESARVWLGRPRRTSFLPSLDAKLRYPSADARTIETCGAKS